MSNFINKIHYAVEITTNTTHTSPTIGLYDGVFRFITDAYSPTSDAFETALERVDAPGDYEWNTDLMSKDGITGMGSSISIIQGGDYAFLQNATVKLVNQTSIGNTIHKSIESLGDLSTIGSTMRVFTIVDGEWISSWYGQVTAKSFSDVNYSFIGGDIKSNSTDTLANYIMGLINAEVTYKPYGELVHENYIAYRMQSFNKQELTPEGHLTDFIPMVISHAENGEDVPGENNYYNIHQYNGLSHRNVNSIAHVDEKMSVQFLINGPTSRADIGDVIKYKQSSKIYVVLDTSVEVYEGGYLNTLIVEAMEEETTDFSFFFDDKFEEYDGEVSRGMNVLNGGVDPVVEGKCSFNIYKAAPDTGIDPTTLNDGTITVIKDGVSYDFTYITNDSGGITIKESVSTSKIAPTKVEYFSSEEPLFDNSVDRDWGNFETAYAGAVEVPLANDMKAESPFLTFDSPNVDEIQHYFVLTFNKDDIGDKELNLGTMLKGMWDGERQTWLRQKADFEQPIEQNWDRYTGDPNPVSSTGVFQESEIAFDTFTRDDGQFIEGSTTLGGWTQPFYNVEYYQLITSEVYGRIPLFTSEITLPNVTFNGQNVDTGDVTYDDGGLGDRDYLWQTFNGESQPATNLPIDGVISTWNPMFDYELHLTDDMVSGPFPKYYPKGQLEIGDDNINIKVTSEIPTDEVQILVRIVGYRNENDYAILNKESDGHNSITKYGVPSAIGSDYAPYTFFNLNGFCLFETLENNEAEFDITYKTESLDVTSYKDLLEEVSQNTGNYDDVTGRDYWKAGLQVKGQEQRYKIVTEMCKQGFVVGFTNRLGIDTYKTFLDDGVSPIEITNDITINKSIKNFKSSSPAMIYNEYEFKTEKNTVEIKNVSVYSSFPSSVEDYSDYVAGVDNYLQAKLLWENCRAGFITTQQIKKAPTDRTTLRFAYDGLSPAFFSEASQEYEAISSEIPPGDIEDGDTIYFDDLYNYVEIGDTVTLVSSDPQYFINALVTVKYEQSGEFKVFGEVVDSNFSTPSSIFRYDMINSYKEEVEDSTYLDEYMDLMVNWCSFFKLQVSFQLPITAETLKYSLMDETSFNDPIITPDLGEGGKGWLTKYKVNTKKDLIDAEITFDTEFFSRPQAVGCDYIDEDFRNFDEIDEEFGNTDTIEEGQC